MIPLDVNLERYLEDAPGIPIGHPLVIAVSKLTVKSYDRKTDQTLTITGDMREIKLTMLPAEPEERDLGKRLEDAATGNRWAAFTIDELSSLAFAIQTRRESREQDACIIPIWDQIAAELEHRREAADGS